MFDSPIDFPLYLWYNNPKIMNKFKTDSNIRYTKALFYETSYTDTSCILYTLKDQNWETTDGRPLKSFYLLFMEYCENDPSESLGSL